MAKTSSSTAAEAKTETRPVWRRSPALWAAASLFLVAGYADLIRGGEVLAPILLIVGYCVLVPMAILS